MKNAFVLLSEIALTASLTQGLLGNGFWFMVNAFFALLFLIGGYIEDVNNEDV